MQFFSPLLFFSCIFFSLSASDFPFCGWTHLELGAGNYGLDGHTKASQQKTVLQKISDVSSEKNYIDELEEVGSGIYNPEQQYAVLFWTLDELVLRYGEHGLFHVNDLYEEYASWAAEKLTEYAKKRGYFHVTVEVVAGDYQKIDPTSTLRRYAKNRYSSVHLKNPEVSFYYDRMDGNHFFASFASRNAARTLLQKLANLSETGLLFFILDKDDIYIPSTEKQEWIEPGIFYHPTADWESVPYIFPEGGVIGKEVGKVFHIYPEML